MGYDLHIVKLNGEASIDIPEKEWLDYVKSDPEFELSKASTDSTQYWEWNAHSAYVEEGGRPWLTYSRGTIYSKNPDEDFVCKMVQVASHFNASVRGDDGEFYDEDGNIIQSIP